MKIEIEIAISDLLYMRDSFQLAREYINAMPNPDGHLKAFHVALKMIKKINTAIAKTHNGHDHYGESYLEPKTIAPKGSSLYKIKKNKF